MYGGFRPDYVRQLTLEHPLDIGQHRRVAAQQAVARKLLRTKRHDVEMSVRGVLRGFGLKVGPTTPRTFEARVRELVEGHRRW